MVEQVKRIGLNSERILDNPRYSEQFSALQSITELYDLKASAFEEDKNTVIRNTVYLLERYGIDDAFLANQEHCLLALAVADEWPYEKSIKEKKSLLDIVKLLAVGLDDKGEYITLSEQVKLLSSQDKRRGIYFDPKKFNSIEWEIKGDPWIEYAVVNRDENLSQEAKTHINTWEGDSNLNIVRAKLGITQETEKPYDVCVLNNTKDK